ncbi:MAG TPA: glycosyltransferase family 4 protein [Roseiflexaceae bacterium]|nr:glycosyltransferase family 4 protein [Roseiflexaceae bacterium]
MRIMMLNYEYPPIGGGASPVTRALSEHLAGAGHEVDVVTMGFRALPRLETFGRLRVFRVPALRRSPVRAVTVEMLSYLASALPQALALARRQRYDVVHAHFLLPTGPLALAAGRAAGSPVVITAHGSDVPGYNPDRFKRGHRLLAPAWRAIARGADAIVSPSHYLRDLVRAGCDVPVDVIPYGFDAPPARPAPKRRRILFVSRLFPRKGAQYLLEALAGLDLAGWEVVVAGDGPMLAPLQEQARALGLPVDFRGFLKGPLLEELYASSAIFALPSLQDNFPVVLLEALSHGCAVITSGISGMPEVVGDAGLLTPPGDVAAIRAALRRLMEDDALRAALGERARAQVAHFGWETILARHLALYERVTASVASTLAEPPWKHSTRV